MRTIFYSLNILFLITYQANLFAQITNAGFENWTTFSGFLEPNGWNSPNALSDGSYYSVTRDTSHYPYSIGLYSIRMENNTLKLPKIFGLGVTKTGSITTNNRPVFPITGHPTSLTGYFKYIPQNGDTMNINIKLYKNGTVVSNANFLSGANTPSWTAFNFPLPSYISADSGAINLAAFRSNGQAYTPYLAKDFEDLSIYSGGWTNFQVTGSMPWGASTSGTPAPNGGSVYVRGNNFSSGQYYACDIWLISPSINLINAVNPQLSFLNHSQYSGPLLAVYVSTNYVNGAPSSASWTALTPTLSTNNGWVSSGDLSLGSFKGFANVHVAFDYIGTNSTGSVWRLDNIFVFEKMANGNSILNVDNLNFDNVIGIQENGQINKNFIYPNPAEDEFTISIGNNLGENNYLKIFDTFGREIFADKIFVNRGKATFNISQFAKGIYFVQIISDNRIISSNKLIIDGKN